MVRGCGAGFLFKWRGKVVDLIPNLLQHMVYHPLDIPSASRVGGPAGDGLEPNVGWENHLISTIG